MNTRWMRMAGLVLVAAALAGVAAGRPNILLITADDLGVQLGCYGDVQARTPAIDRLAGEAVRFTRAYVTQASCSSSRSSMFTGLYPHQNGQIGLAHIGGIYAMRPGLPTIPKALGEAGYFCGVIGKIHVNPAEDLPFAFEMSRHPSFHQRDVAAEVAVAREFWKQSGDRPWFLMANFFDPHRQKTELIDQAVGIPPRPRAPGEVAPFPFQQVDSPQLRKEVAGYYNSVERFDTGVGLLLEALRETGQAGQTLVVLIGDHGPPFNRSKGSNYEAGVHIPMLARWPGRLPSGETRAELVSTVDLFPTLLEAAGRPVPPGLAGKSLLGLFAEGGAVWRETLATEFTAHGPANFFPRRALRDARYKLIHNLLQDRPNPIRQIDGCGSWEASRQSQYEGTPIRAVFDRYLNPPEFEFFDLESDPYEMNNLAGRPEYAQDQERLTVELERWRRETKDPLLDPAALAALTREHDTRARDQSEGAAGLR